MELLRRTELGKAAAELRARIDQWRRTRRTSTERMPESLWREATRLARLHGVSGVARALGINYRRLKNRAERTQATRAVPDASSRLFVELGLPTVAPGGVVLELVARDGAKLTARLPGAAGLDLLALAQALWRLGR